MDNLIPHMRGETQLNETDFAALIIQVSAYG